MMGALLNLDLSAKTLSRTSFFGNEIGGFLVNNASRFDFEVSPLLS
jgi:hypothetical protein